jgi:alkylhydroperoxidase family enzyme
MQKGLTEETIKELPNWKTSNIFNQREKLAFTFAEKLALDHKSIDNNLFRELKAIFSDPEILELGMMIGQYIGFGRIIKALQLEEKTCCLDC